MNLKISDSVRWFTIGGGIGAISSCFVAVIADFPVPDGVYVLTMYFFAVLWAIAMVYTDNLGEGRGATEPR